MRPKAGAEEWGSPTATSASQLPTETSCGAWVSSWAGARAGPAVDLPDSGHLWASLRVWFPHPRALLGKQRPDRLAWSIFG